jgi:hypothetical protein
MRSQRSALGTNLRRLAQLGEGHFELLDTIASHLVQSEAGAGAEDERVLRSRVASGQQDGGQQGSHRAVNVPTTTNGFPQTRNSVSALDSRNSSLGTNLAVTR